MTTTPIKEKVLESCSRCFKIQSKIKFQSCRACDMPLCQTCSIQCYVCKDVGCSLCISYSPDSEKGPGGTIHRFAFIDNAHFCSSCASFPKTCPLCQKIGQGVMTKRQENFYCQSCNNLPIWEYTEEEWKEEKRMFNDRYDGKTFAQIKEAIILPEKNTGDEALVPDRSPVLKVVELVKMKFIQDGSSYQYNTKSTSVMTSEAAIKRCITLKLNPQDYVCLNIEITELALELIQRHFEDHKKEVECGMIKFKSNET